MGLTVPRAIRRATGFVLFRSRRRAIWGWVRKVVILAGGLGTRLREETEYRPKPMVEIGDRPIIWHLMKNFAHQGVEDSVVALGYKGSQLMTSS